MNTIFISSLMCLSLTVVSNAQDVEKLLSNEVEQTFNRGKKIYWANCYACHAPENIMVSSPKLGNTNDWEKRLKSSKNLEQLVTNAYKGKNAMPAKGGCDQCTPQDLRAGILYMMKGKSN